MSRQYWMLSGTILLVAVVMGLSLGAYVTAPRKGVPPVDPSAAILPDIEPVTAAVPSASTGSQVIHCTGCGPTLAERRMQAEMAGLDASGMITGSHDPTVRNYLAQEDDPPPVYDPPMPPSADHRLPERIARFAAGDNAPPVTRPTGQPSAALETANAALIQPSIRRRRLPHLPRSADVRGD